MTSQSPASSPDDVLVVDDLSVRLSGRQILQDVTFSIRQGEFTGLDRGRLPDQLAGRVLRRRPGRGLLRGRAGLGRVPPRPRRPR
jgi:ABC-type multidrug transport system fused ATPase/permease subunit